MRDIAATLTTSEATTSPTELTSTESVSTTAATSTFAFYLGHYYVFASVTGMTSISA